MSIIAQLSSFWFDFVDDEQKVGFLKSLPNGSSNLVLFEADIYEPHQFEDPIRGCEIVFHVATPLLHTHGSQVSKFLHNHEPHQLKVFFSSLSFLSQIKNSYRTSFFLFQETRISQFFYYLIRNENIINRDFNIFIWKLLRGMGETFLRRKWVRFVEKEKDH